MHLLRATVVPYAIFALTIATHIGLMSSQPHNGPGYLGCFRDCKKNSCSGHALSVGPIDSNDQSVEWCFRYCWDTLSSNYTYAGVKKKDECFCGNNEDYDRYRKRPESDCQDECRGNRNQICGDRNRISIYRISDGVCSNDIGPPTNGSHNITNPHSLDYNLNKFKFFGTRIDFYCHDGYTLRGASSIQCINDTEYNNATWNDTVPTCEAIRPTTVPSTTGPSTTVPSTTVPSTTSRKSSKSVPLATATAPPPTVDDPKLQAGLATGEIVGIAVGGISLTLVLLLVILILLWRKRRNTRKRENTTSSKGVIYQNNAYGLTDINQTTIEPPQTDDVVYSNVNPDNTTSDDVYSVPDDVTDTSRDITATQPSHSDSPQDLDTTEWTDNTLYGRALFPTESAQSTENVYKQTDHMEKRTSGWEENTIYE